MGKDILHVGLCVQNAEYFMCYMTGKYRVKKCCASSNYKLHIDGIITRW